MLHRIDHVGIAVADLDEALELYERDYDLVVAHREAIEAQRTEAVLLDLGENHVELVAPMGDDSPVGKFLAKKGPGMHHIAYQVVDVAQALADLKAKGLKTIDDEPRVGIRDSRVAFLHPSATAGVLTELVQPAAGH